MKAFTGMVSVLLALALSHHHHVGANPVGVEEDLVPVQAEDMRDLYGSGYYPMGKRGGVRDSLRDLLHALETEASLEAAEDGEVEGDGSPMMVAPGPVTGPSGNLHSVDKRRRRRYGFWVTAINKMGNVKRGRPFIPALGQPMADYHNKKYFG
ncbi:uncharacterized protein LOC131891372 isoform X2 [Tigriopus californicus]|uniref:uncharacterized protein LOC131891372 isoform X2 n=1 Tax=Tigriopus californicus TaxID=6832 RepID=UPI0027D9FB9D|nr:uncharacterized protein LOC131891372 isoform X2 [Tigriopus californicus]